MKSNKNFFTILILLVSLKLSAQKAGDIIKLTGDVKVFAGTSVIGTSQNIDINNNNRIYLSAGYMYKIIRITSSIVELRALDFKNTSTWFSSKRKDIENKKNRNEYNNKIYTISRTDFDRFYKEIELIENKNDRISIGILSLPFKARPNKDNLGFDTEFNFNSTVSFKVGRFLGTSFNLQLGAGIGTVGLNESNTSYMDIGGGTIQPQDVSTLTILTGLMLEYEKVQVGIYLGWDHINNQKVFNWESNGQSWIGFGVGFSVFQIDLGKEIDKQNR